MKDEHRMEKKAAVTAVPSFKTADPEDMSQGALSQRVHFLKCEEGGYDLICKISEHIYNEGKADGRAEGRRKGRREGKRKGRYEGRLEVNRLNAILIKMGWIDDLERSTKDGAFQAELMKELLPREA